MMIAITKNKGGGIMVKYLILLMFSFYVHSAPTVSLNLSGTVLVDCGLSITPHANATSLNIVGGEVNKLVANITETCNNSTGFTVTVSSLYEGLKGSVVIPYTIKYDGTTITPKTAPSNAKKITSLTAKHTKIVDVLVNFAPNPTVLAGTFADTLTFTITAP